MEDQPVLSIEAVPDLSSQFLTDVMAAMTPTLKPKQARFVALLEAEQSSFGGFTIRNSESNASLRAKGRGIYIPLIWTDSGARKTGLAGKLLQKICDAADEAAIVLSLEARAKDEGALTTAQLAEWYGRYGFVGEASKMTRRPKKRSSV